MGTVHGICFRLLERFAFEASISPRLEILDEAVGNAVISEAIEEVCTLEDVERMERLAVRLNQRDQQSKESRWKGQVKALISRAMENGINPPELGRMAQLSVADLFDLLPVAATGDLNRALRDAIGHAETEIAAGTDTTNQTLKALEQAREARRNLEQGDLTWSKWCALARSTPGKKSEAAFGPLKSVAARVEEHPQLREELDAYTRGLFDIAARSLQSYRQHKEERGQLDFTDLEARVVHLLDHPLVQEAIREEYDLLLVDEFQDTSPLQLALFLKLANLVRGQSIWVGDTKQAIYGFRGSDPELMNSVVATVRNRGGVNPPLAQSYRTRKELCDWFNKLFAPAFEETHGIESVEVALNAARADLDGLPAPLDVWVSSSGLFNKSDGKPKSLTNDQATDVIADGVQTLLGESIQVSDRTSGGLRPLKMRDIVLLCRTNAHADRIADALARRGIPASREGGGLMETPEAVFSLACLKRLVDPEDTLASATIIALDGAKEPEQWLQDRLEWIEPGSNEQGRWGIDGALRHPALVALDEARAGCFRKSSRGA
ncbi:MAG: UvrD-helicase domain-containing protein [Verrucomicrobium sp.]